MYQEIEKQRVGREPLLIEGQLPFVAINDLEQVIERLAPGIDPERLSAIEEGILGALEVFTFKEAGISSVRGATLYKWLENNVASRLARSDGRTGVVLMDRYVYPGINDPRMMRMNLSRALDGGLVSRPGEKRSVDEQFIEMMAWMDLGGFDRVCFVDDVLAFGDTMSEYVKILDERRQGTITEFVVGIASSGGDWRGLEIVRDDLGVQTECMMVVKAGEKVGKSLGMALPTMRDFTVFGGKIGNLADGTQISYPYFLPFSITKAAFGPSEGRYQLATNLLELSRMLIAEIEAANGRPLSVGEVMASGFGLPFTSVKSLKPFMVQADPEMRFSDYINSVCLAASQNANAIEAEQSVSD